MIPFALRRLEPFKFAIKMGPPLPPAPKELSRDEAIKYQTIEMNKVYEKMIRANPGQWLWQHRRFREIITE